MHFTHKRPLYVYFGHHKCATRWFNSIVRGVSRDLGLKHATVWDEGMFSGDLRAFVERNRIEFLSYTNADIRHVRTLPPFRGFHVVRDPRDICVSAYYSHLKTHETKHWPELVSHRALLQNLDKEEGLLVDMDFTRPQLENMLTWDYTTAHIYETRLETFSTDPLPEFVRIFDFLGLLDQEDATMGKRAAAAARRRLRRMQVLRSRVAAPDLQAAKLAAIVERNSFARKTEGRSQGKEDQSSHYRKGQPGDWRNHFQAAHVRQFKQRYNALVLKLGYENNEDWI